MTHPDRLPPLSDQFVLAGKDAGELARVMTTCPPQHHFPKWAGLVTLGAVLGYVGGRHEYGGGFDPGLPASPASAQKSSPSASPKNAEEPSAARIFSTEKDPAQATALSAWADRLALADLRTLPSLTSEILSLSGEELSEDLLRLLAARWAESDPQTGMAEILRLSPPSGPSWKLRGFLLAEWALLAPEAVWEAFLTEAPETKVIPPELIAELLGHEDPAILWKWFQFSGKPLPADKLDADWLALARRHPEEIEKLAREKASSSSANPDPFAPSGASNDQQAARHLAAMLAGIKAENDPAGALVWAQALPEALRNSALARVLAAMADRDPEGTLAKLDLLKPRQIGPQFSEDAGDGEIRRSIVESILNRRGTIGGLDFIKDHLADFGNDTYSLMESLGGRLSSAVLDGSLPPRELISKMMQFSDDNGLNIRGYVLGEVWGRLPPETLADTARWLVAEGGGRARENLLRDLVRQWAQSDSAAAMDFTRALPDVALRQAIYSSAVSGTYNGTVADAAERFRAMASLVPAEERAILIMNGILLHYAADPARQGDPSSAPLFQGEKFAAVLRDVPPSTGRDEAAKTLGNRWGMADPESALAWASAESDPAARLKAFSAVVEGWAKSDAYGASEWAENLPPGPERDTAAGQLAASVTDSEPDSAWAWAGNIADPAARLEAQAAVLSSWQPRNPVEAEAAAATVDPDLRQRLSKAIQALSLLKE